METLRCFEHDQAPRTHLRAPLTGPSAGGGPSSPTPGKFYCITGPGLPLRLQNYRHFRLKLPLEGNTPLVNCCHPAELIDIVCNFS
ncbi:unnamed protein product [Pleuronectes platessa]|uniref:Uncharacterized protein n=1 Tax=Pleuronectes platessa TaxID=8262 RepID=A0A9N7UYY2_PLEPL|nr:unnamed protein product [Pleuronectes platessa]